MEIDQMEAFLAADPVYFDHPHHAGPDEEAVRVRLPDGWSRRERGMWTEFHPPGAGPSQTEGWKIHVSTVAATFHEVARIASKICIEEGVSFKTLANTRIAMAMNSKYAPRTASGKGITVYPSSVEEAFHLANRLDNALAEYRDAPRILTDLPLRQGPVHLRYGAFEPRLCVDVMGRERPAIMHPNGTLTPDERAILKARPDWVGLPEFLHDDMPTVGSDSPLASYEDLRALHFSNGGGVYRARHTATGAEVILKEGRPFSGHDGERDATQRVHQETKALEALEGIPGVPRLHEEFEAGGHLFSVREYVPGIGLTLWSSSRHPRITGDDTPARRENFRNAVAEVMREVRAVIRRVHDRGYVYRDLHPHNVIVSDDGSVSLIDFELAVRDTQAPPAAIGHPPFMAPPGVTGADLDLFSVDALHTWLLVPYVGVDRWGVPSADEVLKRARSWYSLTPEEEATVSRWHSQASRRVALPGLAAQQPRPRLNNDDRPDMNAVRRLGQSLGAAEDAAADHRRADRLIVGHPSSSSVSSLNLATGAAGIIHSRLATNASCPPEWVEWLARAALRQRPSPAGLWTGLDGVALVLARVGRIESALALLARTAELRVDHRSLDLADGLAGISLVLQEVGQRGADDKLVDEGRRLAQIVIQQGLNDGRSTSTPGLLLGYTGMALMAIQWGEDPEDEFVQAARAFLDMDIAACVDLGPRGLFPRIGRIFYPYLGNGSAGLALVAHDLGTRWSQHALPRDITEGLARAITPTMVLEPGLLRGRAGLLATSQALGMREATVTHLQELPVHLVDLPAGKGIPSIGGLRLAHDLETGTAGMRLALACLDQPTMEIVPFLRLRTHSSITTPGSDGP